jgi:hypothetical protein
MRPLIDKALPVRLRAGEQSSDILRSCLGLLVQGKSDFDAIETLLSSARPDYGVLPCGWIPLDIDTFAMDNGGGVRRTYSGVDGYCPLAA